MALFRENPKKKSWQQLSFKRKQTRDGALDAAQARSRRLSRLTIAVIFTAFVCVTIGAGQESVSGLKDWGAVVGLIVLIHTAMFVVVRSQHRSMLRHVSRYIAVMVLFVGTTRVLFEFDAPPILAPVTVLAIVIAIAFGGLLAIHTTLAACMLVALMQQASFGTAETTIGLLGFGPSLPVLLAQLIGAIIAIDGVRRLRTRTRLVVVGTASGLGQLVAIALADLSAFEPFARSLDWETLPVEPVLGLVSGMGSGILVTSALPFIEKMMRLTTDMRLQELADPNNALLRDMSLVAPGSFNHSLMVSQLSQVAAQSIGANDLLARVGALYHDIGKMQKPNYFIENTSGDENVHDRLSPEMSRLIIISHVKDGIRMAEEEGLPRPIIDMIPMHHGTSVVEYFYQKKRQQESERDVEKTGNEAFRYPGPKPTFREAGILMLADSVEAIARVLGDPTPTRLRSLARSVIDKKWADGQLDECELTIRELNKIEDAFVRVLAAIHHGRIRYPNQEKEDGAKGGKGATNGAENPSAPERESSKQEPSRADSDTEKAGTSGGGDPAVKPGEPTPAGEPTKRDGKPAGNDPAAAAALEAIAAGRRRTR